MLDDVERIGCQLALAKQLKTLTDQSYVAECDALQRAKDCFGLARQLDPVDPKWTRHETGVIEDHRRRIEAAAEWQAKAQAQVDEIDAELRRAIG